MSDPTITEPEAEQLTDEARGNPYKGEINAHKQRIRELREAIRAERDGQLVEAEETADALRVNQLSQEEKRLEAELNAIRHNRERSAERRAALTGNQPVAPGGAEIAATPEREAATATTPAGPAQPTDVPVTPQTEAVLEGQPNAVPDDGTRAAPVESTTTDRPKRR